MSNELWRKLPRIRDGSVSLRSRTTMRRVNLPSLSPRSLRRDDSLTEFLKDHAVTSLPPIDLINRFRFSSGAKHGASPRQEFLRLSEQTQRRMRQRNCMRRRRAEAQKKPDRVSPEIVVSVTRSALKPLSKAQLDLSPKTSTAQRPELFSLSPRVAPVVTVSSHLRHY